MRKLVHLIVACLSSSGAWAEVETLAHPGVDLPADKTVIWSPIFQAAWDAMNAEKDILPSRIEPPDEMMTLLDTFRWDAAAVMPERAWKCWAGKATPDFLAKVNAEAAKMTGEKEGPFSLEGQSSGGIAAFGLLNRDVVFAKPLYRSVKAGMTFSGSSGPFMAEFFGVKGELSGDIAGTVRILSSDPAGKSMTVEILCAGDKESVVLHMPASTRNFDAACGEVSALKKNFKPDGKKIGAADDPLLHKNDELKVPYLTLSVKSKFQELGKSTRYYGNEPWKIARAEQISKFELTEKGARVRVESSVGTKPFGEQPLPPPTVPRQMIFDRPFFVFLWRDGADRPYFGAWMGDSDGMKEFK